MILVRRSRSRNPWPRGGRVDWEHLVLACGILEQEFARVRCGGCRHAYQHPQEPLQTSPIAIVTSPTVREPVRAPEPGTPPSGR